MLNRPGHRIESIALKALPGFEELMMIQMSRFDPGKSLISGHFLLLVAFFLSTFHAAPAVAARIVVF